MNFDYADRMSGLQGSAIREMFKLMAKSDIISFAGGNPSPETFPAEPIIEITQRLLSENPAKYLQYGVTAGYQPLIDILKERLDKFGCVKKTDQMMIVTGGQQGIDLAAKAFLDKGDGIAVETPSFVGALNSFRSYEANLYGIPMEEDGISTIELEKALDEHPDIKMLYVIPTFQNPSGITMSLEKRKKLLEICKAKNIIIIEDNPYGELRFEGEDIPTLKALDESGETVIYVGSLSKVLSPGVRIGFVLTNSNIIEKMDILKQANDVHTNLLCQAIAYEWMKNYSFDEHVKKARALYKSKCSLMLETMDETFPEFVTYTRPQGGLFILATVNKEGADTALLGKKCVEKNIAVVPGFSFMTDMNKPTNIFRLNYSTASDEQIVKGIKILAEILKEF